MNRRQLLRYSAAPLVLTAGGCLGAFRDEGPDTDDDGVPDADDPAPEDGRVSRFVPSGDPGISIQLEPLEDPPPGETTTLRVTHEGGDVIEGDTTDRVELAAEGVPISTVPLPFKAGDQYEFEGVPVGPQVSLIWFPSSEGVEPGIVAARTVEG